MQAGAAQIRYCDSFVNILTERPGPRHPKNTSALNLRCGAAP
jgi:hypothetical protein